jgi:flagellar basal-body rod protein FlgF
MLRGLYTVAGAMERATRNQELVSENLVHATTPGYRRQGLIFEVPPTSEDSAAPSVSTPARHSALTPRSFVYLESGSLQKTDNPLDVALAGNAFFTVQGPNGPLYTRNGSFQLGADGVLQTRGGGYPLLGQGGPIIFPADTSAITVGTDGTVMANGVSIGRLQLASFDKSEALTRVGPTLFEATDPQTPPPNSVRIEQGFREGSNVQPVQEMVSMLMGMRFYEAAQKAMQSMSDAVAQNTRPQSS